MIEGDIVIFKRKKHDLEIQLSTLFPKVDDSYDYLLHTKTVDYTEERVKALFDEWKTLNEELNSLKAIGYIDMWKTDLKKLTKKGAIKSYSNGKILLASLSNIANLSLLRTT